MTNMKYITKERTFSVDKTTTDNRGYNKITDTDNGAVFWLPTNVIENFKYVFSWDRYIEENDNKQTIEVLQTELSRLHSSKIQNDNTKIGIKHINEFLKK